MLTIFQHIHRQAENGVERAEPTELPFRFRVILRDSDHEIDGQVMIARVDEYGDADRALCRERQDFWCRFDLPRCRVEGFRDTGPKFTMETRPL